MAALMRLLFDENIGYDVVRYFRSQGHDVVSALESMRGMPDNEIIKRAAEEQRTIITLDKDFASLVFYSAARSSGIVLLRLSDESQANIIHVLLHVIEDYGEEFLRSFIVAKNFEIRIRALPRFSFAGKPDMIDEAFNRIEQWFKKIHG